MARKDWYSVLVLLIGIICLYISISYPFIHTSHQNDDITVILIYGFILPLGIYTIWTRFGTSYLLTEKKLIVKQGPIRIAIELHDIEVIEKSSQPLVNNTTLSAKNFIVHYRQNKTIRIAPKHMDVFINEIQKSNSRIRFHNH
ncbi:PH domain-containing protein [Bacillus sp. Marseille-P3800]|uniref:PH domain-containing protein n=1 Tax=Bacillus sp. Marseille-P3800 TaxID=2014782 RepID=UPI0021005D25|nr:PH domain-containing protein [Bacillus sp. Marseille-P3800]